MQEIKKLVKKRIGSSKLDTVATRKKTLLDKKKDPELLARCERCWDNWDDARRARARAYRMVYGDQLADEIEVLTPHGMRKMSIRKYMTMQGQVPIQTNQLQSKLNTLLGVFIKQGNEPVCTANDPREQHYGEIVNKALEANNRKNKTPRLLRSAIKDIIVGGWGVLNENWGKMDNSRRDEDSWTRYSAPDYFFAENFRDPRGFDIDLIGCWYKMPYNKLVAQFVDDETDLKTLERIYEVERKAQKMGTMQVTEEADEENLTFMKSSTPSDCCVCEVWTAETKERIKFQDWNDGTFEIVDADDKERLREIAKENSERVKLAKQAGWKTSEVPLIEGQAFIDEFYYFRFIAKDGTIIKEGESPRADRSHPFTICIIPFNDGRICGYLNESIDHQIAINRAVVMQDWIARNQIKGFWKIPRQLLNGLSEEAFISKHLVMGNYLFYDADSAGKYKIEFEKAGAVQYDASNWISTLRSLDESSSAISGAIQGRAQYAGMSGYLYQQQTEQSATPITLLLTDIKDFMEDAAMKKCKNIAANYTPERFKKIVGDISGMVANEDLNLNKIEELDYDLEVAGMAGQKDSTKNTMIYLFTQGLISFEECVEAGAIPGGEQILQHRKAKEAEMQQMQQQGLSPEAAQQMAMGGAPQGNMDPSQLMGQPQQPANPYGIPQTA